jgi:hypothetical protein
MANHCMTDVYVTGDVRDLLADTLSGSRLIPLNVFDRDCVIHRAVRQFFADLLL